MNTINLLVFFYMILTLIKESLMASRFLWHQDDFFLVGLNAEIIVRCECACKVLSRKGGIICLSRTHIWGFLHL